MRGQPVHSRPATLHRASAALWQILFDRDRYDKYFAGSRRSRSPAPTVRHSLLLARFPTRFRTQHTAPPLPHSQHTPSTPLAHGAMTSPTPCVCVRGAPREPMSTWREPFPQWALSEVEDRVTAQTELPPLPPHAPHAPPRTPSPTPHTTPHRRWTRDEPTPKSDTEHAVLKKQTSNNLTSFALPALPPSRAPYTERRRPSHHLHPVFAGVTSIVLRDRLERGGRAVRALLPLRSSRRRMQVGHRQDTLRSQHTESLSLFLL